MDVVNSVGRQLHRQLRQFGALVRGVMGEDAYDKYLLHYAESHRAGDHPPMTAREFWRDRDDRLDQNPQGRCC
jgi:uncharacterized short protein YbdD (DUF466 family)